MLMHQFFRFFYVNATIVIVLYSVEFHGHAPFFEDLHCSQRMQEDSMPVQEPCTSIKTLLSGNFLTALRLHDCHKVLCCKLKLF